MNPLLSFRGAVATGFVVAAVLALSIGPTAFGALGLARRVHIVSATHGLPL